MAPARRACQSFHTCGMSRSSRTTTGRGVKKTVIKARSRPAAFVFGSEVERGFEILLIKSNHREKVRATHKGIAMCASLLNSHNKKRARQCLRDERHIFAVHRVHRFAHSPSRGFCHAVPCTRRRRHTSHTARRGDCRDLFPRRVFGGFQKRHRRSIANR